MITNIPIERLHHHPDNPRKDLGDLTELAASIKASGVMQNLTVVPVPGNMDKPEDDPQYYVLIGNRRLEAGRMAGCDTLPCAVRSDMTPPDQVATMLLENMQRADLTVYEQAQGIQMMMDLGETPEGIAEKTGLSASTVRRRVKLLELDQEGFRKATAKGATLMDFAELEKIKSLELRNEVLAALGTKNFEHKLRKAIDKEKEAENSERILTALRGFAQERQDRATLGKWKYVRCFCAYREYKDEDLQPPEDAGSVPYYFVQGKYTIDLYKVCEDTPEEIAQREKIKRNQQRTERQRQLARQAYELRESFIRKYPGRKRDVDTVMRMAAHSFRIRGYHRFDNALLLDLLGIEVDENTGKFPEHEVEDVVQQNPIRALAISAYCNLEDRPSELCWDFSKSQYDRNHNVEWIYDLLCSIGYTMSDEEEAWLTGTHEMYEGKEDGT